MALLGQARKESVFDEKELDHYRRLVDYGDSFKFTSDKDGKDDTIKGIIEVQFKQSKGNDFDIFRFEEFKSYDVNGKRGPTAHFEKIHQRQSKLRFRANFKRRIAYAMVPDTRRNRDLLADRHFDHAGVIYLRENIKDKEIPGGEISRQIIELALLRKADRERLKAEKGGDQTSRTLRNMTQAQKDEMLKRLMAEENAKRTPITLNPPATASPGAASVVIPPTNTGTMATEAPATIATVFAPPRPADAITYQDLRKAARIAIHKKDAKVIEQIKKDNPKGWVLCKDYRSKIAPQIDTLVQTWAGQGKTNTDTLKGAGAMVT